MTAPVPFGSSDDKTSLYKKQDPSTDGSTSTKQFYVNRKVGERFKREAEASGVGAGSRSSSKFGRYGRGGTTNTVLAILQQTVRYNIWVIFKGDFG